MKAVIADIDGKYAVALDRRGSFVRIKYREGMQTGSEIELTSAKGAHAEHICKGRFGCRGICSYGGPELRSLQL